MKNILTKIKNVVDFVIVFGFIVVCCLAFTGCFGKKMDRYLSVVPTDQEYTATLSFHNEISLGNEDFKWKVMRKNVDFCGADRDVIYVEYTYTNKISPDYNCEEKLLYKYNQNTNEGYSLRLNENNWEINTNLFRGSWDSVYGSSSQSCSFVYEFTNNINGRDFPSDGKVETAEYIEYNFVNDNESFKISNDPYHVLLFYSFDYQDTHVLKKGTLSLGKPTELIPYLSTITFEMIGE